ncbi:MAG: alpha/beta hydrolase [Betaproteobacteria bacterium]|nr:alpha/beta hydrolase [Betaproteobacteria bacterium]MDH3436384.1 alpha/beta hydrolase [Betaproteobacteria bacterium]
MVIGDPSSSHTPVAMLRMLWNFLILLALAYAALVALAYFFQTQLVYFPQIGREMAATPQAYGLAFEPVTLATGDGEKLAAWWVPHERAAGTVLIFHGNAGNISHRLDYLTMFYRLGYSSLIVDYRGYGHSTGSPSEKGTYRDAEAAWRWLTNERSVAPSDIVVFGESLGGAVAAWLGSRVKSRALVLASTFTSVPDLGAQVYPFLPVRLISRFSYDSREAVKAVKAPILIAHSRDDDIVPFAHGKALYEAAREPKQFLEMRGGHNDGFIFMRQEWVAQLGEFLESARSR